MGYAARAVASLLLLLLVLKESAGLRGEISSYDVALLYLGFGLVAVLAVAWREGGRATLEGDFDLREHGPVLVRLVGVVVATFWLVGVMDAVAGAGLAGTDRTITFGGLLLLFLAYALFHHRVERIVGRNWPYLLAFLGLAGTYLLHGAGASAGSGRAAYAVAVGFLLVANLFVLPRYVPVEDFLWAASRVSAAVVLLGLYAYVGGEYTLFGLPVELWGTTFSPRLLPVEVHFLQSVFENPNTTGILAFVGAVGAMVDLHRVLEPTASGRGRGADGPGANRLGAGGPGRGGPGRSNDGVRRLWATPRVATAAALLLVNGLGLYLTHSRASMLAAGVSGVVYLAFAGFGRDAVPRAAVGAVALVVVGLAAIASGLVAVNSGGRFVLWSAGVEAFLRAPTLLGEGIVAVGPIIEPYVTDAAHRGSAVHNAYLVTAIRAGLLGVVAYLVLVVGSLVHALTADLEVVVAPIALGLGFAVHQLFESYTLFHHSMPALLAAVAVGYVIAAIREARVAETDARGMADVYGTNRGRSSSG